MKGGGLTWAGWLMVGAGAMLVYAGMTGQSLVAELAGVLSGKGLVKAEVAPVTPGGDGASGAGGAGSAGAGAGGGGGSSWNGNDPAPGGTADGASGFPPGYSPVPPVSPRVPATVGVRFPLVWP